MLVLVFSNEIQAQAFKEYPLHGQGDTHAQLRTAATKPDSVPDTLTVDLPFWDDFSKSVNREKDLLWISDSLWMIHDNVLPSKHNGVNPPSINVITLDGARGDGTPYNSSSIKEVKTDSIVSQFIDLSQLPESQNDSVYLSFFWQFNGNVDAPESRDSLFLYFKNPEGTWDKQLAFGGGDTIPQNQFEQYILQVPASYFSDNFQFKFISLGSPTGTFDAWHLDYFYLNSGRDIDDIYYEDVGMINYARSFFEPYSAIPLEQLLNHKPDYNLATTPFYFWNLFTENVGQTITFGSELFHKTNCDSSGCDFNYLFSIVPEQTLDEPLPTYSISSQEVTLDNIDFMDSLYENGGSDSICLYWKTYIDQSYRDAPFDGTLQNDTVATQLLLHDFYAYDDGTAEFGAGLSGSRGKVAYEFTLSETDQLTHVEIDFPTMGTSGTGRSLQLVIWSELNNADSARYEIYSQDFFTARHQRIRLNKPIEVSGTFYVGFEQFTIDPVIVGLDKSSNSGDKIFFKAGNEGWRQNEDVVGNLMIRPVFAELVPSGIEDSIPQNGFVKIYPTISNQNFTIEGWFDELAVYNLHGQKVNYTTDGDTETTTLSLAGNAPGVYIIKLVRGAQLMTRKVVLE